MIHLVQIGNGTERRVALVEEPHLRCLTGVQSVYELAKGCLCHGCGLAERAHSLAHGDVLDYDAIYSKASEWHLLPPIDVPGERSRVVVSGTGLTHLGSARERNAMHEAASAKGEAAKPAATVTDSMKMFQWGVEGGRPAPGEIGIAPEWFYKGTGAVLRAPSEPLTVPPHSEDGGEEAEIAGVYIVGEDGTPYRIGMAIGNEFSDHQFERRNYLNLAGSKLRTCSIGPELVVGGEFQAVDGEAKILRGNETLWRKAVQTGEQNMCHSLANMEHHHFKFEGHRQPGDVHVHFYGADRLSFGEGIVLQDGDWMEVRFEGFGRALRNPIRVESKHLNRLVAVRPLA
ncbi:MAG: AraD1 family protein [Acidobacteriaceae bacterium]